MARQGSNAPPRAKSTPPTNPPSDPVSPSFGLVEVKPGSTVTIYDDSIGSASRRAFVRAVYRIWYLSPPPPGSAFSVIRDGVNRNSLETGKSVDVAGIKIEVTITGVPGGQPVNCYYQFLSAFYL
jgi:hypothetical protein